MMKMVMIIMELMLMMMENKNILTYCRDHQVGKIQIYAHTFLHTSLTTN